MFLFKSKEQKEWEAKQKAKLKKLNEELFDMMRCLSYDQIKKKCLQASNYLHDYCFGRMSSNIQKINEKEERKKSYRGVALGRQLFGEPNYTDEKKVPELLEAMIALSTTCGPFSGSALSGLRLNLAGAQGLALYYVTEKNHVGDNIKIESKLDNLVYKVKNKDLSEKEKKRVLNSLKTDVKKIVKRLSNAYRNKI